MPIRILRRTTRTARSDEHLSYFTAGEATEFRRLLGTSFAKAGRDVTIYADHVEDRAGTSFGLWNIAALCRGVDRRDWPDVIDDHVQSVTTPPRGLSGLSRDELTAGLYLRLVEAESVPEPLLLGYARQVAPGLLEVLSVDLPDSVAPLGKDDLTALGTLQEVMERGRTNLRSLLDADVITATSVEAATGGSFTAVEGDPFFTASLALLLPETMERFSGEADRGRGVLVAVPCRHQLLYRVIDGRSAAPALRQMFEIARHGYHDEPGPLSPNVYWVRNRRWIQATSVEGGRSRVLLRGELADAIKRSA